MRNVMQSQTLLRVVLNAAFAAVVSFGAIGGVLGAVFPETFFGLADQVICPAPAQLKVESWNDNISVYCVNEETRQSRDQTLLALGVVLGGIFLVIFWIAFFILLIIRAALRKKYGG